MTFKQYLIDAFRYNETANRRLIEKVRQMPDPSPCVRLLSHLVNSQMKWLSRIKQDPAAPQMSWWEPLYTLEEMEEKWSHSVSQWIRLLQSRSDDEIMEVQRFIGFDGGQWEARLSDIAIQLTYHSIHHRAQMQTLIRQQGMEPDFLDYIGTVYRKVDNGSV